MQEAFISSKRASPVFRVTTAEEQNLATLSGALQEGSKAKRRAMANAPDCERLLL
jgi:hypothetical protein